jgi:hypothetical protein
MVFRCEIPLLMFLSLFPVLSSAQGDEPRQSATRQGDRDLVVTRMCNGLMLGRRASCRVYEASDGTQSIVWFGTFTSEERAKTAITQWIQPLKVTHKDQAKDYKGDVIGEHIVGSGQNPKTGETSYVVIRRDILNYWRIESKSLSDAMQLDASIHTPTPVGP